MRTYIGLVLIAAIFTLAGCDTTTVAPLDGEYSESTLNAQGELLHASEFNEESKSSDEELYELAQDIVDFGGFYFDNGSPVMYLKEPGNRNAILAAIRAKTVSSGTDVLSTLNRASGRSDLRILKADFGFSELYQWREAAFSVLHATDGVLSFDVNEKENRVVIGIESPTLEKQLSERLDQAGIPTHGIVFEEGQRVEDLSLRAKHRPAFGGLQIQYRDAGFTWNCSAGPVVMHWYNSKWNYGFLTAAHCTGNRHAVTGVDYYQHTYPSSSNFIGEEYEEMPFDASVNGFWGDVAFVETEPGIELYNRVGRTVLWTSACSSTSSDCPTDSSNPHFTVQGTYSSAWMGVTLNKSGRTTGWTDGTVSNTCIDVQGGDGTWNRCSVEVQRPAGRSTRIADGGDSGSPVFLINPGTASDGSTYIAIAGVLWGGNPDRSRFWYTPWKSIKSPSKGMYKMYVHSSNNPTLKVSN